MIKKTTVAPIPFHSIDIERVVCDFNRCFNPLHQDSLLDFRITGSKNGYVLLSIAMPEGMTRVFVSFLESMHGLFRFVDLKARAAASEVKATDPEEIERREAYQVDFQQRVCSLFDQFRRQGLPPKMAVRETNLALKAQKHPWATHEAVNSVLRAAGKFRRQDQKGGLRGDLRNTKINEV